MTEPAPIKSDLPDVPREPNLALREVLNNINKETQLEALNPFKEIDTKIYPTYNDFCEEKESGALIFKVAKVAMWISKNEKFKTDMATGLLYYGDEKTGKWQVNGERYLRRIVQRILGDEDRESHYRNIKYVLETLTYEEINFSKKIAVENGLLDLETGELTPFNLNEMAFYNIPVKYDPTARKLDNWLTFYKEVVHAEDIPLLQEWLGYCLYPSFPLHYALWVHGEGRNGKGVYDRTIQGLMGKNNVSAVGLEELNGDRSRFALKDFYGKLYNSTSEPSTNKVFRTEIFQKLTGGDTIQAERKNSNDRITFVSCAKLTIYGNKFPKIYKPTTAFKDRMLFVEFPNYINESDRIPNLENVWLNDPEQKSALLNWALEGLRRLLSQGHFSKSKTQEETEIQFQKTSDVIGAFITECGEYGKPYKILRSEAYAKFKDYCEVNGLDAETDRIFTQRLKDDSKIKMCKIGNERAWQGITFSEATDQSTDSTDSTHDYCPQISGYSQKSEERENSVLCVPCVLKKGDAEGESEVSEGYQQLVCVFCGKAIMDSDWSQDNFTWNKPAHNRCYDEKKSQLAAQDREGEGHD